MNDAVSPYQRMMNDLLKLSARRVENLRALKALPAPAVGLSERTCVHSDGPLRVYHYQPLTRLADVRPLLICYAMVNKPYILDLQPDRSFIRELLLRGIDVYLIDWGSPDGADRFTTFADHIVGSLGRSVQHILDTHKLKSLNLLGVCQGGTMSLCYAALEPSRIANLVTMVTPVDFKTPENLLSKLVQQVDIDLMTRTGNVSGEMVNFIFLALMPFRLTQQKYLSLLHGDNTRHQLESFMRMEQWIFDSPDQPATALREFTEFFYQKNLLVRGDLQLHGRAVQLKHITQPVLNIYGRKDHLVPPSASVALGAHVSSKDYECTEVDAGHIGMYVGAKAQSVSALIAKWLIDRRLTVPGKARTVPAKTRTKRKPPRSRAQSPI